MSVILECKNIYFSYGDQTIIKGFSCQVKRGERVSLLGASGSGKTSFLRLCAGLDRPDSGEIYLRGKPVAGPRGLVSARERQVGYIFQSLALFEKVSVAKNVFYGCKTERHHRQAERLIDLLKLREHLSKFPYQLSGGEKQKVALARSLALEPDIIFMDEPFSSIDSSQTQYLIAEILSLFDALDVTALMVTHSLDESKQLGQRILQF